MQARSACRAPSLIAPSLGPQKRAVSSVMSRMSSGHLLWRRKILHVETMRRAARIFKVLESWIRTATTWYYTTHYNIYCMYIYIFTACICIYIFTLDSSNIQTDSGRIPVGGDLSPPLSPRVSAPGALRSGNSSAQTAQRSQQLNPG